MVGGTSRGIRLRSETLRALNEARGKQYSLPLPSLAQLTLPLVGRVAAGSPILSQEHIDQTYLMEASMFPRRPDYLLKVRGMSMRDALASVMLALDYEHDSLNTPRISGVIAPDGVQGWLAIVRKDALLVREVDGVLQVIQHRKYPRSVSNRAKDMIHNVGANLLGVVLNNINVSKDYTYYYYQQHYYYYPRRSEREEKEKA